jgi:hypothetical protein
MLLEMPKKGNNITIKVRGQLDLKINKKGEKSYLIPCFIWCDPRRHPEDYGNSFMLRLNELWNLFEHYKALEELAGEEYKLDSHLVRLIGDILTIKCTDEVKNEEGTVLRSFFVTLREDLKEIERIGEWKEIMKAKKDIYYNEDEIVDKNMIKVDEEYALNIEKKKREIEVRRNGVGVIHNVHNVSNV